MKLKLKEILKRAVEIGGEGLKSYLTYPSKFGYYGQSAHLNNDSAGELSAVASELLCVGTESLAYWGLVLGLTGSPYLSLGAGVTVTLGRSMQYMSGFKKRKVEEKFHSTNWV
jgi:hypothetical protein